MKFLFMNKVIIIMKARSIIMILNKILRRTIAYNLDDKKKEESLHKTTRRRLFYIVRRTKKAFPGLASQVTKVEPISD